MIPDRILPDSFMPRPLPGINPGIASRPAKGVETPDITQGFGNILQQSLGTPEAAPLTFSGHALERMKQRQINLSLVETQNLTEAVSKARQKGAKETLVISDRAAFVVSVTNSTVITVMDKDNLKDNLFTQIDSAILI